MTENPISKTAGEPAPWWTPARHADIRPFLAARSAITRAVRAWFDAQGFAEVETGILQVSPGNETHLHAPRTELQRADGARDTVSPNLAGIRLQEIARRRRSQNIRVR